MRKLVTSHVFSPQHGSVRTGSSRTNGEGHSQLRLTFAIVFNPGLLAPWSPFGAMYENVVLNYETQRSCGSSTTKETGKAHWAQVRKQT